MLTKHARTLTKSKLHNLILTEDQRREKFIALANKSGENCSDAFLEQISFGGNGPLSGPANAIRNKFSK